MEWDLLEKTTFWIENVELNNADLGLVAATAAAALELEPREVMVVDVRPGLVAFDILRRRVQAETVAGKEQEILRSLAELPGVNIKPGAAVHSEGVLGLIALEPEEAARVLAESEAMAREIGQAVARRAIVFASGSEVIAGKIKDTNSPYIISALEKTGYRAKYGGILEDDAVAAANRLEGALEEGYGLIITTGGVGAEDKDFSIEAILRLDPGACTPWILKFKPDYHRHHKEGVRIAVGKVGLAYLVALPGPHEEARLGCDRLLSGLEQGLEKESLAEYIAGALRERWRSVMKEGGHEHGLPGRCC
ncbi:molybdopterin-binding protein [Neomoorella humiferrea]|uniref:Bifunctional molybdenum cofactor biosynthesis protein MoaC/MogA n=1 Tax=Neomoorella humiferrea TaxID=676965 RepID=A0A2T0AKG2_9FIRM|nr:molybdopterin-binding protein [Moorella humiferrea]PRR69057.1 bifunctional molybdenum cofactor biosynthesis protein MoaC/MogA [Moorella humiferrea]